MRRARSLLPLIGALILFGVDAYQLQDRWRRRARAAQISHYKTAVRLESWHRRQGVIVVTLNALVGTAVFASLSSEIGLPWRVATGIVSVLAAVGSAIQAFDRAGERAEAHRTAATQFSALQRDIELYIATRTSDESDAKFLGDFNARYIQIVNESPTAGENEHNRAKEEVNLEIPEPVHRASVTSSKP